MARLNIGYINIFITNVEPLTINSKNNVEHIKSISTPLRGSVSKPFSKSYIKLRIEHHIGHDLCNKSLNLKNPVIEENITITPKFKKQSDKLFAVLDHFELNKSLFGVKPDCLNMIIQCSISRDSRGKTYYRVSGYALFNKDIPVYAYNMKITDHSTLLEYSKGKTLINKRFPWAKTSWDDVDTEDTKEDIDKTLNEVEHLMTQKLEPKLATATTSTTSVEDDIIQTFDSISKVLASKGVMMFRNNLGSLHEVIDASLVTKIKASNKETSMSIILVYGSPPREVDYKEVKLYELRML